MTSGRTRRDDHRDPGPSEQPPSPGMVGAQGYGLRAGDVPVACSLPAEALPERLHRWAALLDNADRQELTDGVRFTVPIERSVAVTQLCLAEQECCPFFDFVLHLDRARLHLDVRVPAHVGPLLDELVGLVR